MTITQSQTVQLCALSPDRYEALASFLASFPDETRDQTFWLKRFRYWWEENPAFSSAFERGWILEENSEIVGFLGIVPSFFQWEGENRIVFNSTTWRVLPSHRNHSMGLLFRQVSYARDTLLFSTTPNELVSKINESLHYELIKKKGSQTSLLIVNFEKSLADFLGQKPGSPILIKILAPVMKLMQNRRSKNWKGEKELEVRGIQKTDSLWDDLWNGTRERYRNTAVRTAEVLNWYCFGNEYFPKKLFGVFKNKHLRAYMMFKNSTRGKTNLLECIDFWGETGEQKTVKALLGFLQEYAQKNSIDMIKFPGFSKEISDGFRQAGLWQVQSNPKSQYVKGSAVLMNHFWENGTYFSEFVGDNGL